MELDEPGANPRVRAPTSAQVRSVVSTIDPSPEPPESSGPTLSGPDNLDVPGPSTTYLPRQTSPPLPDLRFTPFPPNEYSDDDGDGDDDDNEVVAQLPIYLSPALHPHLNLYQYPLLSGSLAAPEWAKERGKTMTARVKEQTGRVEVEIPVDEQPRFWRDDRATELGFIPNIHANGDDIEGGFGFANKADGKTKPGQKKKSVKMEKWGDKRRLRGDIIPNAPEYYTGMVHDGALHLHPISKLVQFRPTMTYLDDHEFGQASSGTQRDEKSKIPAKPVVLVKPKLGGPEEAENDGSGSIRDFRNKMMSEAKKEEEDQWVAYDWRQGDDNGVLDKVDALLVPAEKQYRLECSTTGLDYLNRQ
ncbi:Sin-like protein conserved region-domain-containing protein [Kockovaella imperatae]|uniref:Sin-like protein conserved region-domain-containing protein n=1 Tax=Kockovaella imperatae TaxID=4999 RepID=A0A1Y1USX4_9TREE|nr:Sin-like protein conserved region-domain-containing protein [Kockovaella imperatae]ORX41052.1 Sin-like protein conserved region-domain-containing protein [Kockovaella imperatae]